LLLRHRQPEYGHKPYEQIISLKNYVNPNNIKYAASPKYFPLERGGFLIYITPGAHINFYLMGFEFCLSGDKTACAWNSPVTSN